RGILAMGSIEARPKPHHYAQTVLPAHDNINVVAPDQGLEGRRYWQEVLGERGATDGPGTVGYERRVIVPGGRLGVGQPTVELFEQPGPVVEVVRVDGTHGPTEEIGHPGGQVGIFEMLEAHEVGHCPNPSQTDVPGWRLWPSLTWHVSPEPPRWATIEAMSPSAK